MAPLYFDSPMAPSSDLHVKDLLNRFPESADTFQDNAIRYILLQLAHESEVAKTNQELLNQLISITKESQKQFDAIDKRVSDIEVSVNPLVRRIDRIEDPMITNLKDDFSNLKAEINSLRKDKRDIEDTLNNFKMKFYIGSGIITGIFILWTVLTNTNVKLRVEDRPAAVEDSTAKK